METDDFLGSKNGVVCCLRELKGGKLRLVLDDVVNESGTGVGPWTHHTLFTFKDFERHEIEELKITERELASFGLSVLARLVALRTNPVQSG